MIGAEAAGYRDYFWTRLCWPLLMLFNAFQASLAPLSELLNTIPTKHPLTWQANGEFKYGATWAPLKPFPRLDPGYERAMRIKVSPENLQAFIVAISELEAAIIAAGHDTFMNGLFGKPIGGGTTEAEPIT